MPHVIDAYFSGGRLPGRLAKIIAKQILAGLNYLHQRNIGHGGIVTHSLLAKMGHFAPKIDIYTRNLAFTMPCMEKVSEDVLFEILGKPETGRVQRHDGKDLELGMPECIMKPTSCRTRSWNSTQSNRIIDFAETFLCTASLHTPLLLFELFTGQPPFDVLLITPLILNG
ncbi:hypothetical protein N7451_009159 [Penicillium sp. IBT 35674x]|nr:hypothetical protein N7451_009159 [Penicillium sp. IBT 35674x]